MKTRLENTMTAYVESAGERENGKFTNWVLSTRTENGPLELKFWNMQNKDHFPDGGQYLKLTITDIKKAEEELEKYKNISLDSTSRNKPYYCETTPLNEEDVPEETRKKIKRDRKQQLSLAVKLLEDESRWKDKDIHAFLLEFIKKDAERFTTAPAAVSHHHNYRGGLLVHTSEVFANCVGVAGAPTSSDRINTDALYLAAWLHDAGKMEVYRMEGDAPKIDSDKERKIGHPTISNQMFREAAKAHGLDAEFIDAVSHCILSHHERRKWGAVVEPDTIEAHILCRADFISSRMPD
jgi:response regulator RpfG family c-di-GMP phosphodiesterase